MSKSVAGRGCRTGSESRPTTPAPNAALHNMPFAIWQYVVLCLALDAYLTSSVPTGDVRSE